MAIVPVEDLEHIVFSGGGSRAVAHVGAVRALERKLGARSLAEARIAGKSELAGFAGASAGAFVAMAVATGYGSSQLETTLMRWMGSTTLSYDGVGASGKKTDVSVPFLARLDLSLLGRAQSGRPVLNGKRLTVVPPNKRIRDRFVRDLYIEESLRDNKIFQKIQLIEDIASNAGEVIQYLPNVWASLFGKGLKKVGGTADTRVWADKLRRLVWDIGVEAADEKRKTAARIRRRSGFRYGATAAAPLEVAWLAGEREFPLLMYNLLVEGGLLTGYGLRSMIKQTLLLSPLAKRFRVRADLMTLRELQDLTARWVGKSPRRAGGKRASAGFELATVGTNLTTREVGLFSPQTTPDMPVVDAVAISMRYPFLYKPVQLWKQAPVPERYRGSWVDGGLLNNFPLQAFAATDYEVLGHRVLGFYLREDRDYRSAVTAPQMLAMQAGEVLGAVLSQSTTSSMRSLLEELQSVELVADGLSTLDMTPDRGLLRKIIHAAEKRTAQHFDQRYCSPKIKAEKTIPARPFEEICRTELRTAYAHVSRSSMRVYVGSPTQGRNDRWADFDILAAKDDKSDLFVYDAKGSDTAPLTDRQAKVIKLLAKQSGYISPTFPEGPFQPFRTVKKQTARILRPENLCVEVSGVRYQGWGHAVAFPPQSKEEREGKGR